MVTVIHEGETTEYYVYGETNAAKEMKKLLKNESVTSIPTISCNTVTEKNELLA